MASAQGARVELGTGAAKLDVRASKAAITTNSLGGRQLDPSQYNRNGLVDVWVSASVQQVFDIDTATQTFGLDAWINCLYFDPKVQREATEFRASQHKQRKSHGRRLFGASAACVCAPSQAGIPTNAWAERPFFSYPARPQQP